MKQLIKIGFVLLFIIAFANPLLSEESKDKPPEKSQQTAPKKSSETSQKKPAVTTPQEIQNPPQTYPENILKEVDCRIDRAIGIISIIATCIAIFVAAIAIILTIAVLTGFFEYRRWRQIRKETDETLANAKKDAKTVTEIRENLEKYLNGLREEIKPVSLTEKPSKELKEQIDEFSKRLELVEVFGVPLNYEDLISRGNHFYFDGEFEHALKSYEKAVEMDPNNAKGWGNKSLALSNLDRYDDALSAIEKAIEIDPNNAAAWINKSPILIKLDRYDDALSAAEKAIEIDPNNAAAWGNKSLALKNLDRYDDALSAIEKAIEIDPNDTKGWANKSSFLIKLDRYDDALSAAEKAIEIDPNYVIGWYNRACAYSLKGDKEKALNDLKKGIELDESCKKRAREDEDFKSLWDDEDFKKLTE